MKIFIKILLLLLVAALAAPFILKGPDGRPWLTLEDIRQADSLQELADALPDINGGMTGNRKNEDADPGISGKTRVYSWRDKQGNLHYSNIEPAGEGGVETLQLDPNINVIPSQEKDEGTVSALPLPSPSEEPPEDGPGLIQVYTPEGAEKVINDAKSLEGELQHRYEEYDRQIEYR